MKKHKALLTALIALLAAFTTAAWAQPYSTPTYSWSQDNASLTLGPADAWFCGFKHLQGKFEGSGEGLFLEIEDQDGVRTWTLGGKSNQHGVYAEAFCIPGRTEAKTYTWTQGEPRVNMGSTNDRICTLTGVSGKFEGSGEKVEVFSENSQWYLGGKSNQHGVSGTAACFERGDAQPTPYDWNEDEAAKDLGSAASRQCFLQSMSGQFEGAGERIHLRFEKGDWRLGGHSNKHGVSTSAICID